MKLILSHSSALAFWRAVKTGRAPRPEPSDVRMPGTCASADEALRLRAIYALDLPIHLLVAENDKRSRAKHAVCHVRKGLLPRFSLERIDDQTFVTSPEYCFVQLSTMLSLPELIDLGFELCGTYSAAYEHLEERFNFDPLTNVTKLKAYVERAGANHGIVKARRAMRCIMPNAASSMEATVAMLLSLPYLLGGCSLSRPKLNHRIDPGKHARKNVGQDYYKVDLFWKKSRLAVEYDSNLYHTGAARIAADSRRRDELSHLGVTVITITANQVFDVREFNKVARTVAKRLGERIQPRDPLFANRQLELRTALLAKYDFSTRSTRSLPQPDRVRHESPADL